MQASRKGVNFTENASGITSMREERDLDINLRSSCLACEFVSNCPVVDVSASPDSDTLIGTYRFSALKTRCLV
ncbi:MAG: hypothetical protein ACYCPP_06350 [Nitrososphaerales archaeon]